AYYIVIFVADPTEGIYLAVHPDTADGALPVALLPAPGTNKWLFIHNFPLRQGLKVKALGGNLSKLLLRQGLQSHSIGSHEPGVRRDHELPAGEGCHCHRYRLVVATAALHENLCAHRTIPLNPV